MCAKLGVSACKNSITAMHARDVRSTLAPTWVIRSSKHLASSLATAGLGFRVWKYLVGEPLYSDKQNRDAQGSRQRGWHEQSQQHHRA